MSQGFFCYMCECVMFNNYRISNNFDYNYPIADNLDYNQQHSVYFFVGFCLEATIKALYKAINSTT